MCEPLSIVKCCREGSWIHDLRRPHVYARWLLLLTTTLCATTTGFVDVAYAQPTKDELAKAETKALQAKFKFKAEAYGEAAELFLEAFSISKSPALLFNAARAFEEAKRYKEARAAFEQYLSLNGIAESGQEDARKHIAACEAKIAEQAASGRAAPTAGTPGGTSGADQRSSPDRPQADVNPGPSGPQGDANPGSTAPTPQSQVSAQLPTAEAPSKLLTWTLIGGGGVLMLMSLAAVSGSVTRANNANNMDFSKANAKETYKVEFDAAESGVAGGVIFLAAGIGIASWGAWRLWRRPAASQSAASAGPTLWGGPSTLESPAGLVPSLALGGSF